MKRRTFTALACVLALGMGATSAQALSIGDANYLGNIVPGLPAAETNEAAFITVLIGLATGTSLTPCADGASERQLVHAQRPILSGARLSLHQRSSKTRNHLLTAPSSVTGFAYILAKYGKGSVDGGSQISHVWYVGNLSGNQTVPTSSEFGGGLSHISRFNATSVPTPDGGTTLMLLGTALVGLGALRRRFNL